MAQTCADCKYHQCNLLCFRIKRHCNGICTKQKTAKLCYRKTCKDYKFEHIPKDN